MLLQTSAELTCESHSTYLYYLSPIYTVVHCTVSAVSPIYYTQESDPLLPPRQAHELAAPQRRLPGAAEGLYCTVGGLQLLQGF